MFTFLSGTWITRAHFPRIFSNILAPPLICIVVESAASLQHFKIFAKRLLHFFFALNILVRQAGTRRQPCRDFFIR
jgi:hypothetical protein